MNHIVTEIVAQTAYLKRTESWLGSPGADSVIVCNSATGNQEYIIPTHFMHAY